MSSLENIIPFDCQGVLGFEMPSLSILAFAGTYDPKQLMLVIKTLQENAERVAHASLYGRKEFMATGLPYIRAHTVRMLNTYFRETFFPESAVIS